MSEQLHPKHELQPTPEQHQGKERENTTHEKEHQLQKNLSEIEKNVEASAVSSSEVAAQIAESSTTHQPSSHHVRKDIKNLTFTRTMVRVRKRLSTPDKVLSSFIHQPAIDRVSETAGKTVARPSGLLGGGLLAFVGTLLLLYITRKYGYEFNYLVFFMLFVGGFLVGATCELVVYAFKHRKQTDF